MKKWAILWSLSVFLVQCASCSTSAKKEASRDDKPVNPELLGTIRRPDQEEMLKKLSQSSDGTLSCLYSTSGWVDDGQYCFFDLQKEKVIALKKPAQAAFVESKVVADKSDAIEKSITQGKSLKDFHANAFDHYKYEFIVWKKNGDGSIAREQLLFIDNLHVTPKTHTDFVQEFKVAVVSAMSEPPK